MTRGDFCIFGVKNPDGTVLENVYYLHHNDDQRPLVRAGLVSGTVEEWVVRPVGSSDVEVIIGEWPARWRAYELAAIEWARLTQVAR